MTKIKLINSTEANQALTGLLRPDQIRTLELEALVDTGATMLALPAEVIEPLGLVEFDRRPVRMADGSVRELPIVGNLRIEILGRGMTCDALVLPKGTTALVGQIPLEGLDLVVDPKSREAKVNPASPDAPMYDLLRAS